MLCNVNEKKGPYTKPDKLWGRGRGGCGRSDKLGDQKLPDGMV